jgi:hypothetical protein
LCEPCGDSMTCACTEPFESEYVNDCLICQCPAVPD